MCFNNSMYASGDRTILNGGSKGWGCSKRRAHIGPMPQKLLPFWSSWIRPWYWIELAGKTHFISLTPTQVTTLKYFCKTHEDQRVFQFQIIINILVSSSLFIWIPICYVSTAIGNILILSVRGLTLDVRIWRLQSQILTYKARDIKTVPALKRLMPEWQAEPRAARELLITCYYAANDITQKTWNLTQNSWISHAKLGANTKQIRIIFFLTHLRVAMFRNYKIGLVYLIMFALILEKLRLYGLMLAHRLRRWPNIKPT